MSNEPTSKKGKSTKQNKYDNVNWKEQTDKIARFCNRRGFDVKYIKCKNGCSTICFADKEILIHNGSTPEHMFYCLLHEMGHMLIHENPQMYTQNLGFSINNFHTQSLTQRIGEVEEEFDAWRVGYKTAKKMRLKVDRIAFERLKASYLSTYFEWAIERKINKKINEAVELATKKAASKKVCDNNE